MNNYKYNFEEINKQIINGNIENFCSRFWTNGKI